MEYFFYCRDRAGAGEARRALLKAHWAFMEAHIPAMIARGPTMAADGRGVTGSMHIVELADAAAARSFAHDDPLAQGGVFDEIRIRCFRNESGRTMWQYGGDARNPRFLFIGEAPAGAPDELPAAQRNYFADAVRAPRVIVRGPLLDERGGRWSGSVLLLETPDVATAQAIVRGDPAAGLYARSELLPWRFGGAENLRDLLAHP